LGLRKGTSPEKGHRKEDGAKRPREKRLTPSGGRHNQRRKRWVIWQPQASGGGPQSYLLRGGKSEKNEGVQVAKKGGPP